MRRMGIDPGTRRTGVALAEPELRVACPSTTLQHGSPEEGLDRICEFARSRQVEQIVLGLPLRLDGTEGEAARRARRLAEALEAALAVPVVLWDERLTTVAAERALTEQGVFGRERRRTVDQAAATLLLQSFLDAQPAPDTADGHDPGAQAPWYSDDDPTGRADPVPVPDRGGRRRGRRGKRRT